MESRTEGARSKAWGAPCLPPWLLKPGRMCNAKQTFIAILKEERIAGGSQEGRGYICVAGPVLGRMEGMELGTESVDVVNFS